MTETVREAPARTETSRDDPADRGHLEIDHAVLRKIVEHAAGENPNSVRNRGHRPHARVTGPNRELRVRLDLALRYPASIRETVRDMREHVRDELDRLTDCRVRLFDVTVSALIPAEHPPRVE